VEAFWKPTAPRRVEGGFFQRLSAPLRPRVPAAQAVDPGVELRAGIHTGEVQPDGDDISGIAVAIGARIGALAGRGEVLVSSTVKDLVVGSGLGFEDRGTYELKGVPDAWQLYALGRRRSEP
jgi:class 3 adenylate cyclase